VDVEVAVEAEVGELLAGYLTRLHASAASEPG